MRLQESRVPPTTWKKRLQGTLAGAMYIAIGWWLMAHRLFVGVDTRYRQPVFAVGAIAAGALVILVSIAPARLIVRMAALKKYRPYRPHRHERLPR